MASLTLRQIVKRYGNNEPTLKGIDLEVEDGEFLVLVGPSGCGKSTLLRIIAGLESITGGDLSIGDRVVNTVPPKERDIAMVFQSYALYPHMTVKRNMSFGLEVRKTPRDEIDKLVNDAARMLGLQTQLNKLPKQLSGGQRQRVAMGRAIVRRPKVFLFDEPLSNLDAKLRAQMRVEIKRLHLQLATTMVYVTHDQVEAMTLAERIAVLDKGILQQVGTPLELFNTPTNRFVAGFIGSPSMNFLDATIEKDEEDSDQWLASVPGAGSVPVLAGANLEASRPVILGLRPQDLRLVEAGQDGALMGKVDVVETLGWESHVHLDVDGTPVLAAVEARDAIGLEPGDIVHVAVEDNAYHLFDSQTEESIQHGASQDREFEADEPEAEAG